MERLKKYLNSRYMIIIVNILIFLFQFLIIANVGLHGIDDIEASTYHFQNKMSIQEKINQCVDRFSWNKRFGEMLYFFIGIFPDFVFWILASIIMLVFVNEIVYLAFGKKEYINNKNMCIYILFTYFLCIYVFPRIPKIFFWKGAIMNHLFSIVLLFLLIIPIRDRFDGIQNKFNIYKYLIYVFLCIISGFGTEAAIPVVILMMFIENVIYLKKNHKFDIKILLPMFLLTISYFIFIVLSKKRIQVQGQGEYATYTKKYMFSIIFKERIVIFLFFAIITLIYFIVTKNKRIKNIINPLKFILISALSIVAMIFSPYYECRGIAIFDSAIVMYIVVCFKNILEKFNNKHIKSIIFFTFIIINSFLTLSYVYLYKDYNEYCRIREEYIQEKIKEKPDEIILPIYDMKVNLIYMYDFYDNLILGFDAEECFSVKLERNYQYFGKVKTDYYNEYNIKLR